MIGEIAVGGDGVGLGSAELGPDGVCRLGEGGDEGGEEEEGEKVQGWCFFVLTYGVRTWRSWADAILDGAGGCRDGRIDSGFPFGDISSVRVICQRAIQTLAERFLDALDPPRHWANAAEAADWETPLDARPSFNISAGINTG